MKVKLIVGLISNQSSSFLNVKELLKKKYGHVDTVSPIMDFIQTSYYQDEFGTNLKKIFYSFKKLINEENSYKIKLYTNTIEHRLSCENKRQINIDPGYITLAKLVLLTTKNYTHRIYLNKSIYAEATLKFEGNSFQPWPWTYPDYKRREYIDFFNKVRDIYKKQLKRINNR